MHRTTLYLDNLVFQKVKAIAATQGTSMAKTVDRLLRLALDMDRGKQNAAPARLPLHKTGPREGVDIANRDRLYDLK